VKLKYFSAWGIKQFANFLRSHQERRRMGSAPVLSSGLAWCRHRKGCRKKRLGLRIRRKDVRGNICTPSCVLGVDSSPGESLLGGGREKQRIHQKDWLRLLNHENYFSEVAGNGGWVFSVRLLSCDCCCGALLVLASACARKGGGA
jgi:hypothetical protein